MILGVIPARYSSSRLRGKPLAMIGNKPMIWHTYMKASESKLLDDILIAVDDKRVYDAAKSFGARVKMTPENIPSGSDRIAYAVKNMKSVDIVVNIQGDEPFIKGEMIDEAIEPLLFDKEVEVSTLAKRVATVEELKSASIPKVVFDYNNYALYFSRSPIPFVRDVRTNYEKIKKAEIYKHVGMYVYRKEALMNFTSFKPTDLELTEKLEQLRMLENGMKIKVVVTEHESFSVDTPEDLERARQIYDKLISL